MKFARVFIRPYGDRWFNLPLRDDQNCMTVFSSMRAEGAIIHPEFIIPQDMVHYIQTVEFSPEPNQTPAPWTPPGKPN